MSNHAGRQRRRRSTDAPYVKPLLLPHRTLAPPSDHELWTSHWFEQSPCPDCGLDDGTYYQVHNRVWKQAGLEPLGGWYCPDCLAQRLGRQLRLSDFTIQPHIILNYGRRRSDDGIVTMQEASVYQACILRQPEVEDVWLSEDDPGNIFIHKKGEDFCTRFGLPTWGEYREMIAAVESGADAPNISINPARV